MRPSDEGIYRCLARNALGQVEAPASLTVLTPGKGEPWALGTGGVCVCWWWIEALECVSVCLCACGFKGKYGFTDSPSFLFSLLCPHVFADQLNSTGIPHLPSLHPGEEAESEEGEDYY